MECVLHIIHKPLGKWGGAWLQLFHMGIATHIGKHQNGLWWMSSSIHNMESHRFWPMPHAHFWNVEAFPKKIPVQLEGNQSEVNCSLSLGDSLMDYIVETLGEAILLTNPHVWEVPTSLDRTPQRNHETYRKEILRPHTPRCNNPWQTGTPLLLKTRMAVKTLVFSGDSNTIAVVMFISIIIF